MQNRWVIVGCGGHARSIADVILYNDQNANITFLDENAKPNEKILGFPVVSDFSITDEKVIIGVGDNKIREKLSQKYYSNLFSVISNRAYIGRDVKIGKGVFVAHNAYIGVLSTIDDFSIINTGAIVEHECNIARSCFVGPNATLCGKVRIMDRSFIGAGANIKDNVSICSDIVVGAGATIVNNITVEGTYVGCPAKLLELV